jgi:hypothetical protein
MLKFALFPCSTLTLMVVSFTTLVSAVVSSAAGPTIIAVVNARRTATSEAIGSLVLIILDLPRFVVD